MFSKYFKVLFSFLIFLSVVSSPLTAQCCEEDPTPCDQPGGCDPSEPDSIRIPLVHSVDPNDITGNAGYGEDHWVSVNEQLGYRVRFENDPNFATAPAQAVEITVPLEENLNITDFRLSDFGFGMFNFQVPPNSSFYSARLDVVDSMGLFVDITAGVDVINREAFWRFQSIDPATGLPPEDALAGFLPVNDTTVTIYTDTITQQGEGYVSFTIKPRPSAITGDSIHAQASIIFDENEVIPTNIWENIIDAFPPETIILPIATNVDTNFLWLNWTGQDDFGGVGLDDYDLFVSKNGAPFYLFEENIDTTAYLFTGESGAEYCFFTLGTDFVKNKEAQKTEGDICVNLGARDSIEILSPLFGENYCGNNNLIIEWETIDIELVNIYLSTDGGNTYIEIDLGVPNSNSPLLLAIPDTISSDDCYIQISPFEGGTYVATSERFSIHQGNLVNTSATSCDINDVGTFEYNLVNQYGCDSIVILTVTYAEMDTLTIFQTTCIEADTSTVVDIFQNQFGCDSIVTNITEYVPAEISGLAEEETICLGDEVQLEIVGGNTFSWTPSLGLSNIDSSITIASPTVTTTYYVTSEFTGNCVVTDSITIFVDILPSPTISISGDTLYSDMAANYQWYLDGNIIDNATEQFFVPTTTGNYSVEIINENGCTATSEITFVTVGTTDLDLSKLVIKPNPASDFVTIEIETTEVLEDFEIELVGLLGQKLMTYYHGALIGQLSTMIHLDQYPSGVYILLLKSKNRVHFEKIVVTR